MRYISQSYNACFAYALWQIGVVEEKAVREYEDRGMFESWYSLERWAEKHVPQLKGLQELMVIRAPCGNSSLEGKGIIALWSEEFRTAHAISYEEGLVLDPSQPEERMTLEDYLNRFPKWKVVEILPVVK